MRAKPKTSLLDRALDALIQTLDRFIKWMAKK